MKVKPSEQFGKVQPVIWNEKVTVKSTKLPEVSVMRIGASVKVLPFVDAVPLLTITEEVEDPSWEPPARFRPSE